ncbi:tether containing UBX domain for GLUT4 isoform X2 [Phymastichus coffea]|nr:tether containing UBX domain for GLUT4 isoform X2 [Phymastichus coffea]
MVKCKIPRKVSNVTICVQLENGKREIGVFSATVTIEKILDNLGIEFNTETAIIIFMHKEIYSKEFETTTIKSLGLTNGKALFRLLQRDPKKFQEQAHVYNISQKPKIPKIEECDETKPKRAPLVDPKNKALNPLSIIKSEKQKPETSQEAKSEECKTKETYQKVLNDGSNKLIQKIDETLMEIDGNVESCSLPTEELIEEPKVEYLGDRDAILFNQTGAKTIQQADIPDDFFELTRNDAKALLRDVKKMQSTLEETPLLTEAQRELEKNKGRLHRLYKYQETIIRIQFPNQLILQGRFRPLENIQAVKDFVRKYLENPESDFTLYTAPPRCNLSPKKNLIDQDLVPSAIIHYSGSSDLRLDIKSKLTDPAAASIQALKIRLKTTRNDTEMTVDVAQPPETPIPEQMPEMEGTNARPLPKKD